LARGGQDTIKQQWNNGSGVLNKRREEESGKSLLGSFHSRPMQMTWKSGVCPAATACPFLGSFTPGREKGKNKNFQSQQRAF
jgi:hypothetical protein